MYAHGLALPKDDKQALAYMRKAADRMYQPAQFYLVEAYFTGRGVEQDYRLAVYWLNEAVRGGYAPGQLPLGEIYDKAHRPEQVHSQAWYRQTAEREIAKVQYNFGVWYYNGYHLNKDRQLALEWYLKAAERGLVDAEKAVAGSVFAWRRYEKEHPAGADVVLPCGRALCGGVVVGHRYRQTEIKILSVSHQA